MINLDDEDSKPVEKKPAVKPEVKREKVKPSKEYRFNPVISPIFGIDEKDMDAVKTTTSKLTEKEKAKFEKNVTPILSPIYGIAIEKPVKPVVKVEESVVAETVKKSEPVKIPSPTVDLEKETAEDSTTIISRSSLNDHSSHK